jgi:hypothetical protein
MKSSLFTLTLLALFSFSNALLATTWTVSNNADRPAQYTTIQAAVNDAAPGDTILITSGNYAGMTSFKNLVFYGEDRVEGGVNISSSTGFNFSRFNSTVSSSGSRVYNIQFLNRSIVLNADFANNQPGEEVLEDFIFERCLFANGRITPNIRDGISNITIRNCSFYSSGSIINFDNGNGNNLSNIVVTNCLFDSNNAITKSSSGSVEGNVVVRNCLFLNSASAPFGINELVVENSIFYNRPPSGCNNCTFNNNFTFLTEGNNLPYGTNLGSGNITSEDPFLQIFEDYPQLGANFSFAHDYSLAAGSPCIGTGTNGSDIGINDGNAPVTNIPTFPKIPTVTALNIPVSSVPVGGTLQINVAAESR